MPVNSFKWKHYAGEIILLNVRWYLKYSLSYRNLEEMMAERGVTVDHTTIMRWVHQYSPEIEKKVRRYLKPTNDSWRMDETYIRVKVVVQKILISKQIFSFTSKNIKKQNISQITSRFRQLFRITGSVSYTHLTLP